MANGVGIYVEERLVGKSIFHFFFSIPQTAYYIKRGFGEDT